MPCVPCKGMPIFHLEIFERFISKGNSEITIGADFSVYTGSVSHYDYSNQAGNDLYEAKIAGRNRSVVFDEKNHGSSTRDVEISFLDSPS